MMILKMDAAADTIQQNFLAWRWNRRAKRLLNATLRIQRVWIGAVQRKWLRDCNKAATEIQRFARGMLVRMVLDRPGRELSRRQQVEINAVTKQKNDMTESMFISRMASVAAKARLALHKHRERNVELRRMAASTLKSKDARLLDKRKKMKMKGTFQIQRSSIWQPVVFALKERQHELSKVKVKAQHGAAKSQVLTMVMAVNRGMDRIERKVHAAARRAAVARTARRLAKIPEVTVPKDHLINDQELDRWMGRHIAVRSGNKGRNLESR